MTISADFSTILHSWYETFVRRSIHELVRFSKDAGISVPQMSALFHIYHGNECGVSNIGEHLGVTNAAASQMIDRLVQNGLVERKEDPHDRRVKQLGLTGRGNSIVQQGIEIRRRWMEELMDRLTIEEQQKITAALRMLVNAAKDTELSMHDHLRR